MKRIARFSQAGHMAGMVLCFCAAVMVSSGNANETAGTTSLPESLAGTEWRLVEFQSMDDAIGTVIPDDPSMYTMHLKTDGTVSMLLNCNRATGIWTASPGSNSLSGGFEFGPLAVTRALCPPPSMDERIARDAEYVRSYVIEDGTLYLSLMADGGIYAWAPDPVGTDQCAAPEGGGPRNWEVSVVSCRLNLRAEPSTSATILARYSNGTILDNLGCRQAEGRTWCDVQQLGGGPRGYVAYEYLTPAVSPDGGVARGRDDSAERAGRGEFDATGQISCATASGQPMGQCEFGVARAGGGYATVVITKPDGRTRAIYFRMGIPIGADGSEADGYSEFSARKKSDLHIIVVGDERYEIPAAIVLGG